MKFSLENKFVLWNFFLELSSKILSLLSHRNSISFAKFFKLKMSTTTEQRSFDFVVIGAGSGGVSCSKRAASYGAKVAVGMYFNFSYIPC